jgi:hypothetical protein
MVITDIDVFSSGHIMTSEIETILYEGRKLCSWINEIGQGDLNTTLEYYENKEFWNRIHVLYSTDFHCCIDAEHGIYSVNIATHYTNSCDWNIPGFCDTYLEYTHVNGKFFVSEITSEDDKGVITLWWRPSYETDKDYLFGLPKI